MARTYARIRVDMGQDPDWLALTHHAQWLYMSILAAPRLDVAGCLIIHRSTVYDLATDVDDRDVDGWLKGAGPCGDGGSGCGHGRAGGPHLRHRMTGGAGATRTSGRGMWSAWAAIKSPHLRRVVVDNLPPAAWEPRFNPPHEARDLRVDKP